MKMKGVHKEIFRWLQDTVFDGCISFAFFSKTLYPLVAKNGNKQVNFVLLRLGWHMCGCHGNINECINRFCLMTENLVIIFFYNLHATSL